MQVFIKAKHRQAKEFQFYMHQFFEACEAQHIPVVEEYARLRRSIFGKLMALIGLLIHLPKWHRPAKAVIVCSRGRHIVRDAMPYALYTEVIPMFWDSWPRTWNKQVKAIRSLNCKICFFTSSEAAYRLSREVKDIKAYWIPEGIDCNDYTMGPPLQERSIDVYELGRQKADYHCHLIAMKTDHTLTSYIANEYDANGKLKKLAFDTATDLLNSLPDIRIVISFPSCDTHPVESGGMETLTQRYWEAMLCGCLIIGRAPKELIQFIGYNPVIDADFRNPRKQLSDILEHIGDYQELVNRNRKTALQYAPWESRAKQIKEILRSNNYSI
ncbi:MAG: glycosyltransferase [Paraprevotella sp.]|nr:glycosyltransferase [Paraprevotella sp.]